MWKKILLLAVGILAVVGLTAGTMTSVSADNAPANSTQSAPSHCGHPGGHGGHLHKHAGAHSHKTPNTTK